MVSLPCQAASRRQKSEHAKLRDAMYCCAFGTALSLAPRHNPRVQYVAQVDGRKHPPRIGYYFSWRSLSVSLGLGFPFSARLGMPKIKLLFRSRINPTVPPTPSSPYSIFEPPGSSFALSREMRPAGAVLLVVVDGIIFSRLYGACFLRNAGVFFHRKRPSLP